MSLERMQKARTGLITNHPFFGMLALRLDLVEDPAVKASAVDGRTLRFNPAWAADLPMAELEGAVAHQVMTCALGHHTRRAGRDAKVWNEASDYAVNAELIQGGFSLPPGSLTDADGRFKGLHAEAIYAKLKEIPDPDGNQSQPQPQGGGGNSSGTLGQDASQGDGQGESDVDGQPQASQSPPGGPGKPEQRSGASATGSFEDPPAKEGEDAADAAELAEQEADWQTAVAMAAQASRGAGKLPGSVERAIDGFLNPKVSWQEALQRYFRTRAKDDYSWSRPNRRYPFYMPSLDSQKIGDVAIAIDCSGSISTEVVRQFVAEIEDIRSSVKPPQVIVMPFDTRVRIPVVVGPDESIKFTVPHGGGTAFDDPVRVLDEMGIQPELLIYLTDLDSSVFPVEPLYPVLWVTTRKTRAPFGEVIEMN